MIGTKLYSRRSRLRTFIILYGILGVGGLVVASLFAGRGQEVPGAAGFMIVFGLGMAVLTWNKGRKPLVAVHDEYLELNFQRRPQFIVFKNISTVNRTQDGRLAVAVRDGHDIKNVTVWLKELEAAEGDRLAEFLQKKGWKAR